MSADLSLLRPLWLAALPLLLLIGWRLRRAGPLGAWAQAIDPALLAALARRGLVEAGAGRRLPAMLVAALIIALALSGPARESAAAGFRNLDGVVLALDAGHDAARHAAASRLAAQAVLDAAQGRQVALLVYAGDAYLAAPFSADPEVLKPLVASDPAGLVPDPGVVPARALDLAGTLIDRAGLIAGDVVLVTDGTGIDATAEQAAGKLRAAGRRVHVLFAGDAAAATDPARDLAATGGGRFASLDTPGAVTTVLAQPSAERLDAAGYNALSQVDLGRWLLVAAAVPLLLAFRRRT